jgi:hypothetical protein
MDRYERIEISVIVAIHAGVGRTVERLVAGSAGIAFPSLRGAAVFISGQDKENE